MSYRTIALSSCAVLGAALLVGCSYSRPIYQQTPPPVVYQQAPPPVVQQVVPAPVLTTQSPPPPQTELYGTAPGPGYFWVSGIWLWENGRHVWHPGHWEAHRPGHTYVPHSWIRNGEAWELQGGYWTN